MPDELVTLPTVPVVDLTGARLLNLVRSGEARTRPELGRLSGLGRAAVSVRIDHALAAGLLEETADGPATGGRTPRLLRFRADAGRLLVAVMGTRHVTVGLTDLDGTLLESREGRLDVGLGPEPSLSAVADIADELLARSSAPLWAVAMALPGAVDFDGGRTVGAPVMPGWEDFGVRDWLVARYGTPAWVDNDLNLLVLAQARAQATNGPTVGLGDVILVKVSYGIGAGILSNGRIHRGHNGSAGDIGHSHVITDRVSPCRCGQNGCLEAVASGWAIAGEALTAARAGSSAFLASRLEERGDITPHDVAEGARMGDATCRELVVQSAAAIGHTLSVLVGFFNPGVVYVGGLLPEAGDLFLFAIRRAMFEHALPLATRDLRILPASVNQTDAIQGAARLAIERLFDTEALASWLDHGSPVLARQRLYG